MRRWLALFLLVLLPLLSTWSAAAPYCNDESGARAQHLGHHADKHHDDGQDGSQPPANNASDADCDHCHSPGAMLVTIEQAAPLSAVADPTRHVEIALRAPPLALPERPNWARLA